MRTRLRRGDPDALGELYDEHAQVLYRYALRVTGDWAEAEDVVSTTFLEAWRGREKLHPDGDGLRPWLLGIATNIMRRTARARRRRDIALARLPERGSVPDFTDDLVAHLADAEHLRAAHRALARLRRRDREVFTLVVWAGLDYASAAEALGTPVGTVRSRLSRARARLRELTEAEARAQARADAKARARARAETRVPPARHRPTGTGKPPAAEGRTPRTPSAVTALPVPGRIPALRPSIRSIQSIQESHG
ncbi:RNA polymerase sigma factor [Kitasatospora sp. NPDC004615]|uniref:RNA polymerase sigma factor n=1 Tax=Kitasatospora sp. NPDC004615 TaxID=3364017 RepID=UPI00368DB9B6